MGFSCLFSLLVAGAPRLALVLLWIFRPERVEQAFETFLLPILGDLWRQLRTTPSLMPYAVRGAGHTIGVMLWFYAMTRITVAEVVAMNYVNPIYVTIGAALFLGERFGLRRAVAIGAACLGAFLVMAYVIMGRALRDAMGLPDLLPGYRFDDEPVTRSDSGAYHATGSTTESASGAASRITLKPLLSGSRTQWKNKARASLPLSRLGTNLLVSAWVAKNGTNTPLLSAGSGSAGITTAPPRRTSRMTLMMPSRVEAATLLPSWVRWRLSRSSTAFCLGGR